MLLKKVKIRLSILLTLSAISVFLIFLVFKVLEDNVLYFYSPSEIKNTNHIDLNKKIRAKDAEKLFSLIEKFAEYGFNKSHAAAYAFITYYTAYLKAHYPKEFYCELLNNSLNLSLIHI